MRGRDTCGIINLFLEADYYSGVTPERKVQTAVKPCTIRYGVKQEMERKLQRVSASVSIFYPHVELRTNLELTRFERNRNEWI